MLGEEIAEILLSDRKKVSQIRFHFLAPCTAKHRFGKVAPNGGANSRWQSIGLLREKYLLIVDEYLA
jgi:hypothetical protein